VLDGVRVATVGVDTWMRARENISAGSMASMLASCPPWEGSARLPLKVDMQGFPCSPTRGFARCVSVCLNRVPANGPIDGCANELDTPPTHE